MKKTIILTGGGTAGHIMPNLALLPLISKKFDSIYYFGSKNSMEEKIIANYSNITFVPIPTTKLIRKFSFKNLAIPFKLLSSIKYTKRKIKEINPNVIFCKGGFVSVPVAIAGKMAKVPVVSHESDLTMGLANKIILKFANKVCTSFTDTAKISKKCVVTGSPIREQIFKGNKRNILNKFSYNSQKPTVLFFGGSLGSKNINQLVYESIKELTTKYNILHIVGKGNKKNIKANNYYQVDFVNNIEDFFNASDCVVCRGGANSLFELLALKKPCLIIPLSKAESRGDQIENAKYFKKHHHAEVMQEDQMTTRLLLKKLSDILSNKQSIQKAMHISNQNSNQLIVDIIEKESK